MSYFEAFFYVISSSISFLFLKSDNIRIIFFLYKFYTSHSPARCFSFSNFFLDFKVWLNQHFFLKQQAINCTVLKAKKRDANEILLSMSVPDDAISAVLFLLSNLKAQISFQKSKKYAVWGFWKGGRLESTFSDFFDHE